MSDAESKQALLECMDAIDRSHAAIQKLCDDISDIAKALAELDRRVERLESKTTYQ